MKKYFLISIIGLLFVGTTLTTSCKKDEETDSKPAIDINQYVGTWNVKQVGSLTFSQNGSEIGTYPIDTSFTVKIEKSGDKDLKIDNKIYHVDGEKLTADPENITETESGLSIVAVEESSGTLGSNTITIHYKITGSWTSSVANGTLLGTTTSTLTK